jgi:hypothetical protein
MNKGINKKHFLSISKLIVFIAIYSLISCTYEGSVTNVILHKDAEEESVNFITEGLPYYNKDSNLVNDTIYVRFYDNNRYIPYVSVRYFLEAMGNFKLKSTSYADGKYKYQNLYENKNFSMVVDVKADIIYCPEWIGYLTKTSEKFGSAESFLDKFINIIECFTRQKARTFDLHAYGMKIYGGTDDAYIPLCVMNQLFACTDFNRFVYNGEGIYYIDNDGNVQLYESYTKSSWYKNSDGTVTKRPSELIELSYNLLCFTHDYLYGQPGYYGFADDGTGYADLNIVEAADKLNLDQLLQNYDNETRTLLKSSSYDDYFNGLKRLTSYTYGDLHSSCIVPTSENIKSKKYENIIEISETLKKKRIEKGKTIQSPNEENIPLELEVLPNKKTAVIRFDSFDFDESLWKQYYEQDFLTANPNPDPTEEELAAGKIAVPNDTMGLFYRSFYTILNDDDYAKVENVIIDLSCNSGGIVIACQKALAYLLGHGNMLQYDVHTDTTYHKYTTCDLNLDGEIDSADTAYYQRLVNSTYIDENGNEQTDGRSLNFAILTSFNSFSCGNLFPARCYDAGIPIIGKRSGGGSCTIMKAATADGWPYNYSGSWRWTFSDGSNVENGVPVTKELTYDQFYDDEALQNVMNELFGKN